MDYDEFIDKRYDTTLIGLGKATDRIPPIDEKGIDECTMVAYSIWESHPELMSILVYKNEHTWARVFIESHQFVEFPERRYWAVVSI